MNDIYHHTYTLEFDIWDPQKQKANDELSDFLMNLKNKVLLPHVGNVKLTPIAEDRIQH